MTITTTNETLQPGRELDAKVYEATGHTWFECWNYEDVYDDELGEVVRYEPLEVLEEVPHYSTLIGIAWQLVEKAGLTVVAPGKDFKYWQVGRLDDSAYPIFECWATADTAPHAICLAYLALVENESGVKG